MFSLLQRVGLQEEELRLRLNLTNNRSKTLPVVGPSASGRAVTYCPGATPHCSCCADVELQPLCSEIDGFQAGVSIGEAPHYSLLWAGISAIM